MEREALSRLPISWHPNLWIANSWLPNSVWEPSCVSIHTFALPNIATELRKQAGSQTEFWNNLDARV
jgi:hypothetical protein